MDNLYDGFKNLSRKNIYVSLLFLLLLILVYGNALNNDFLSDDLGGIVENPHLGNFRETLKNPFFFFLLIIRDITYHLAGFVPWAFRLHNFAFHFGSTFFVYLILKKNLNRYLSLMLACIFLAHPLLTESVSWISGVPYVSGGFFLLGSLYYYLYFQGSKKYYALSVFMFLLGINSNTKSVFFPLALAAAEFSLPGMKKWKRILPFLLITLIYSLKLFGAIGTRIESLNTDYYQNPGFVNPLYHVPLAIGSYIILFFWPEKLTFYHSELPHSFLDFFPYLFIFGLYSVALVWGLFKNRLVFFSLSLLLLSLTPNLLPINIAWLVAERYVYFGVFGLLFFCGLLLKHLIKYHFKENYIYTFLFLVLIILSLRTINRNIDWRNQDNLWVATARYSPSDPKTHNNMGDVYFRHKDYQNAELEFKKAIELNPRYADAVHNLGNVYLETKNYQPAKEAYEKAALLNPKLWQSYQNLAAIAYEEKNLQKASGYLKKAITINPQSPALHYNLGVIEYQLQNYPAAKEEMEIVLQLTPDYTQAQNMLLKIKNQ